MKFSLAILSALLLFTPALHAQKKERDISLRFLSGVARATMKGAQLQTPEWQGEIFLIPYNQLSLPQPVKARALRLFQTGEAPEPSPVCDVILPEQGDDFIVILVSGEKGTRAVILNGKAPDFRPGDVFIHNASENAIALALGSTKAALNPGQGKAFRPGAPSGATSYEVAFLYEKDGTARRLALTQWPLSDVLRGYVFFLPGKYNRPIYRAVQEIVPRG